MEKYRIVIEPERGDYCYSAEVLKDNNWRFVPGSLSRTAEAAKQAAAQSKQEAVVVEEFTL